MNQIIFNYIDNQDDGAGSVRLDFNIPWDADIYEVHRLCKMFALTLGYSYNAVENAFGETIYDINI